MQLKYSEKPIKNFSNNDENVFLVTEMQNSDIKFVSKSQSPSGETNYIFEGVFTKFGVKNKNGRIYEKAEFDPHLEALQESIKNGGLLGELDHPKDFEIQFGRASHVIENLQYDKESNSIRGKIRLIGTPQGKVAMALADAGVKLNVSSRSAGVVKENGVVELKKVFTYDLVADPGFAQAELTRVNENSDVGKLLKESKEYNNTFNATHLINESFGLNVEDSLKIYKINKNKKNMLEDIFENDTSVSSGITPEQLKMWGDNFAKNAKEYIQRQVEEKLEERVNEKLNNLKLNEQTSDEVTNVSQYVNYLSENFNKFSSWVHSLKEGMNGLASHNNYTIEGLNSLKEYVEDIASKCNKIVEYNNYLSENNNQMIAYSDYIAETLNNSIKYSENNNQVSEKIVKWVEDTNSKMNHMAEYVDLFSKDYEGLRKRFVYNPNENQNESNNFLTESNSFDSIEDTKYDYSLYEKNISNKLDKLITVAVNEQKSENNKNKYDINIFINSLDKEKKAKYFDFPKQKQQKIYENFCITKPETTYEVNKLWEDVVEVKTLNYMKNMPEKYKSKWLSLTEAQQHNIMLQAEGYSLKTKNEIDYFWDTRDLRSLRPSFERVDMQNENKQINESYQNNSFIAGFDPDYFIQSVQSLRK